MEIYTIENNELVSVKYKEFLKNKKLNYWFNVNIDELLDINKHFDFNDSTINECIDSNQEGRLEVYDNYSFGVINSINHDDRTVEEEELDFFIGLNFIVLVTKTDNNTFTLLKNNIIDYLKDHSIPMLSPGIILYSILNNISGKYLNFVDQIESKLYDMEVSVFEVDNKDFIKDILNLRKQVMVMKKVSESLLDISEDFVDNENNILDKLTLRYYRNLVRKVNRINMNITTIREYLTQVREAYQAQVDIKLNNIMKFFTVISAIFLPLTFLVGWYGMNFKYMPEFEWKYGYLFALLLSIITVMMCIAYFKNKKYM